MCRTYCGESYNTVDLKMETENRTVEMPVTISPQVQKVLSTTKYTLDDFIEWIKMKGTSFGGGDVILFLEKMGEDK